MFIRLIISIGFIIFNKAEIVNDELKWIESITKTVQNDREIHQVIFIIDRKTVKSNQICDKLIRKVTKNVPILEILTPITDKPTNSNFVIYNPRISLFILLNSENNDKFTRSIDFLLELSEAQRRPKCLILLFHNEIRNSPMKLFENLWTRLFLDVTVIEIGKQINKTDLISFKMDHYSDDCKVMIYNPFLKLITTEIASAKTIWFPDKMKNMYGYPLIASLLNAPPDVFYQKNDPENVSGLAVTKLENLQKVMNFTFLKSSIPVWGLIACTKAKSTGIHFALVRNQIQMMGLEVSVEFCNRKAYEFSKSLKQYRIGMAVPILIKDVESVEFKWQIKSIFIVMIVPLFFWIISRILMFNPKKWQVHYMFQLTLGNVIPTEPNETIERIIFTSVLLGCFMFSSEIFTAINQVQLETKSSFKFETLEDVLASNIQILINNNYFFMMNDTDDVVLRKILDKSVFMNFSHGECLERLLKYKNFTCIMELPRAELQLRNRKDKCGQPLVKLLNEKFPFNSGATAMGAGIPYAKRIDQIIQRIIDSGIRDKWMEEYSAKKVSFTQVGKSCSANEMKSVMNVHQVLHVIATGLVCSIITFILELIVYRVLKNKSNK